MSATVRRPVPPFFHILGAMAREFMHCPDGRPAVAGWHLARVLEVCLADTKPKQPLDVLICTMRELYDEGRFKEAADIAKAAAPYVHPRAMGRAGVGDISTLRDDELDRLDRAGGDGTRASPEDPD